MPKSHYQKNSHYQKSLAALVICALTACATKPTVPNTPQNAIKIGENSFQKTDFADLPNWTTTDHKAARIAFIKSCSQTMALPPDAPLSVRGTYAGKAKDWAKACNDAGNSQITDRDFWQTGFSPYKIASALGDFGRLTSYYEPVVEASLAPTDIFNEPLFAKPKDLVTIELGPFDRTLAGKKIVGRNVDGVFTPYLTRAEINTNNATPIAYAKIGDALTIQVQGSGRLRLNDGREVRVAHTATNGHPFGSIATELIRRGYLQKDAAGMPNLMAWFETADPKLAREVINTNPRTVFFEFVEIKDPNEGPKGSSGLPLTAGGSLAVDPNIHPYGVPIFISAFNSRVAIAPKTLTRFVVSQDSGGAIKGPIRGDLYWGSGQQAGIDGGNVNYDANWWVLLPNEVGLK